MPTRVFANVGLVDLPNSLEKIGVSFCSDNDIALVLYDDSVLTYRLDADSNANHNPPYVVMPEDGIGNAKRWILASPKYLSDNFISPSGGLIQTGELRSLSTLTITSSAGVPLMTFDGLGNIFTSGLNLTSTLVINTSGASPAISASNSGIVCPGLNAQFLDGYSPSDFLLSDVSGFTGAVSGVNTYPIDPTHLVTFDFIQDRMYIVQKGIVNIPTGFYQGTVTFPVASSEFPRPSNNTYTVLTTISSTEATPVQLIVTVGGKTTAGFNYFLSGIVPSDEYFLEYIVIENP